MTIPFVAAFAVVMVGLAWPLVRRLDRARAFGGIERATFAFALGTVALHFAVWAVGQVRLDAVSMGAVGAATLLLALPGLARIPWRAAWWRCRREAAEARRRPWRGLLWLAAVGIAAGTLLQGLAPPNDYDGLMYHLALPRHDLELGRMAIAWGHHLPQVLYPAMGGNLSRFVLPLAGDGAAQVAHGLYAVAAAVAAAALARRAGAGRDAVLAAAVLFLAIRVVVWQMATTETDVPLAALAALALVAYLGWRADGGIGAALLFGLLVGGAINMKYHGYLFAAAFAPLMLVDLVKGRITPGAAAAAVGAAFLLALPHMARNVILTGNPVAPLFGSVFAGGSAEMLAKMMGDYGTGRGVVDFLASAWNIFVVPMRHFDGMVFGAPYLLALAPLVLLAPSRARAWLPALAVAAPYYAFWFWIMGQQVRFLLPLMPMLAGIAAAGAAALWQAAAAARPLRWAAAGVMAGLALNQAMFIGVYALIRLPAALGFEPAAAYLTRTPNMGGDFYRVCSYVAARLKPGERYFSSLRPHSYYCPQASATTQYFEDEARWWLTADRPPEMAPAELLRRFEEAGFRFVVVQKAWLRRRNETAREEVLAVGPEGSRFGALLAPALARLAPLIEDRLAAVYDGAQVLDALRRTLSRGG